MERRRVERLVRRALASLPSPYDRWLANIDVVVEPRPRRHQLAGLGPDETLFGLYEGVPLTERGSDYGLVLPDKITTRPSNARYWTGKRTGSPPPSTLLNSRSSAPRCAGWTMSKRFSRSRSSSV